MRTALMTVIGTICLCGCGLNSGDSGLAADEADVLVGCTVNDWEISIYDGIPGVIEPEERPRDGINNNRRPGGRQPPVPGNRNREVDRSAHKMSVSAVVIGDFVNSENSPFQEYIVQTSVAITPYRKNPLPEINRQDTVTGRIFRKKGDKARIGTLGLEHGVLMIGHANPYSAALTDEMFKHPQGMILNCKWNKN